MLEIRTLGGLSLGVDGKTIKRIGSQKAEAILVYLAVEGRQVSRNTLAALFWPESSQEHASRSLRVALSALRKNLGTYLEITREAVRIKSGSDVYLDLNDLDTRLGSCHIQDALDLYRGDFLEGVDLHESTGFEDWLRCEQQRLQRSMTAALHNAIQQAAASGELSRGLNFAQRLLELDPLDERAHQVCMILLAQDHQRSAALAQYETCREVLEEQLEVPPSQETQDLYQKILKGESPPIVEPHPQHNLPAPQSSFVGRETELGHTLGRIHDPTCRLLTLVGPGGSGKTRLALEAAARALHIFPDGVYFVPLESIPSSDYIVPAVAAALQFTIDTVATPLDAKIQLLDYLKKRKFLLVMDGCEHLVAGTDLLAEMIVQAPGIMLLATSRQKLDLKGEWIYPLEGLPMQQTSQDPTVQAPAALRLFSERARQANPGFELGDQDYEHALRICQLVEGMPLGIELAAAWTAVLSPGEILQEMEKGFDFLAASTRDITDKHRSLRGAFDSSWMLLTEDQQQAFIRLSVFRAGFERQAAFQVAGVDLQGLSALLDRSLLKRDAGGRFSMHAMLCQFAVEKLLQNPSDRDEIHERHCRYYVDLLSSYQADFMGPRMLQARDDIRPEMENIRAALDWASLYWESGAVSRALVSLLCSYIVLGWHAGLIAFRDISRLRREALLESGIPDPSPDPIILSAHAHQAFLLSNLGQIEESEELSRDCLEGLGELDMREELSECLHNLGVNASFRGEYERAGDLLEKAIRMGRACEHVVWPTYMLWLGHAYFLLGEYEQGMLSLRKCYDIFQRAGNLWGSAFAMGKMGLAADGLGDHVLAMDYHCRAQTIFERAGNQAGQGYSLSRMSMSACFQGDFRQALEFGRAGLDIFEQLGHRWGISTSLSRLGFASLGLGEISTARSYFMDALKCSWHDQMLPLSLYALAGLACVLVGEGDQTRAHELYCYIQHHPQTPAPYLEQVTRWLADKGMRISQEDCAAGGEDLEPVESLVARLLE